MWLVTHHKSINIESYSYRDRSRSSERAELWVEAKAADSAEVAILSQSYDLFLWWQAYPCFPITPQEMPPSYGQRVFTHLQLTNQFICKISATSSTHSCVVASTAPVKVTHPSIYPIRPWPTAMTQYASLTTHSYTYTNTHRKMHKITLQLNHQNDGNLCWLSDRSWLEASVDCHHDLRLVKHGTVCSLSAHWWNITELLHVQLTQWYHMADTVYRQLNGGTQQAEDHTANSRLIWN